MTTARSSSFELLDLERGGNGPERPPTQTSLRAPTRASTRLSTFSAWSGAAASFSTLVRSEFSNLSKILSNLSNNSQPSILQPPVYFSQAEIDFLFVVTGRTLDDFYLTAARVWYISFLKCRISEAWVSLFSSVLGDIDVSATRPSDEDLGIAFRFLAAVAKECRDRDSLALTDIVDRMYNDGLLRDTDDARSEAYQLVFASIGWISILYSPNPRPQVKYLEILEPPSTSQEASSRRRRRPRVITNYKETLNNDDLLDQPLYRVLRKFGKILPKRNMENVTHEKIDLSLICFHIFNSLHKDAAIEIEWTECLAMHLDFDNSSKTLKLFRFPSLCFLMCQNPETSLMTRIFRASIDSGDQCPIEDDDAREYFKEVILSLHLIFAQRDNSYRAFNKHVPKWNKTWTKPIDPLLEIICGNGWKSEAVQHIFDDIDADPPSNDYRVTDFPYLGKRLKKLQTYVRSHKPHNLLALWRDKRDAYIWWAFWTALLFTAAALVITILGLVLQVVQVFYARQQSMQGPAPVIVQVHEMANITTIT